MAGKLPSDNYASKAVLTVTESAANTITFEKLETGLSVYDKIGWIVSRIEYQLSAADFTYFNGAGDNLTVALAMTNSITAANLHVGNPAVYDAINMLRYDLGTAATGQLVSNAFTKDFSTLPGGGLLILPNPLYLAAVGSGLTTASVVTSVVYFKAVELNDQDYFNLVQARQLLITT